MKSHKIFDYIFSFLTSSIDQCNRNISIEYKSDKFFVHTGCFFRMVPPKKVLSVEDGKIPTKKVKVGLFNSKMLRFHSDFHFFGRDLPTQ